MSAIGEWKLVPAEPTPEMIEAMLKAWQHCSSNDYPDECRAEWIAALAAAPQPPHMSMTSEEAATFQNWRGMDGACAFHLIERHADGWSDVGRMMDAWLAANHTGRLPQITHVAIKYAGRVWALPKPNRHHDVVRHIMSETGSGVSGPDVQGFLDNRGRFLRRAQAYMLAELNGQLNRKPGGYQGADLYSEDLW